MDLGQALSGLAKPVSGARPARKVIDIGKKKMPVRRVMKPKGTPMPALGFDKPPIGGKY